MKKYIPIKNAGFSLVELLIYLGLVSVMLTAMATFIGIMIQSSVKNMVITTVDENGASLIDVIGQSIRNAESITLPAANSSSSAMTLDVVTPANDPTIFDLSNGVMQIKKGNATVVQLSASQVIISNLSFYNVSRTGTPGSIKYQFTLTYRTTSNRPEYSYSKTFYGSASLR